MKILLVYPQYPDTFWSFRHALKFISKKAVHPPLGLLTVAAMLPGEWEKKLIDMNVVKLKDKHLMWADYVFIGAMAVQKASVREVIARCKAAGVKTVAGGPLFTASPEDYPDVDHLVLNEAECTLGPFLADLSRGEAKHLYTSGVFPDLDETPVPLWNLVRMNRYHSMNLQYSRGCPFSCEFCDITTLYGRRTRSKSTAQVDYAQRQVELQQQIIDKLQKSDEERKKEQEAQLREQVAQTQALLEGFRQLIALANSSGGSLENIESLLEREAAA